ncbi:UNKNOWN [Stylonychia lemnae]|uniref:Uncharacterized protein n=1 Tax=Stylonychia lemnae TaxID=5949 RepID=A0A077ZSX3_STYLE|nr:UNKNOWN [Stylonychia lemnae]|eukprot:CDW72654.1 UNKNOWN [Stylonychia lemnae]
MDRREDNEEDNYSDSENSPSHDSPGAYFDDKNYYQHQKGHYQMEQQIQRQTQSNINSRQQLIDDELQNELISRRQQLEYQNQMRSTVPPSQIVQDRIQKLFNETKDIQKRVQQDQSYQKSDRQEEQYQNLKNDYFSSDPNMDLKDSLRFAETQINRMKDTNIQLTKRYEHAQEEIEKSHDQIARQAQHNHNLKLQNERLQQDLDELVMQNQNLLQRQSEDAISFERRIEHLSQELQQYKKMMISKDDSLRQIQLANEQLKEKNFQFESEISLKIEEIDNLRNEARKKEELLDQFFLNRGAETAFKIEMEQLREDNKRLMKLLKSTKEYQEFANYVEDSGGNVRNVEKDFVTQYEQQLPAEDENWVPQEAFTLAHQFREKSGNELTPQLVNQLLQDLNKIWREREKKQIQRIKQQSQNEIIQLKRQLSHRTTFDEVHAKKNISRLKNKLHTVKTELSKTQAVKDKAKQQPVGIDLVDNTLQIITSMQQQRKLIEQENQDLKDKLKKFEMIRGNQDYDKAKYMEGAVWMGKRVTNEIEKVCTSIESIIAEYNTRTAGVTFNNQQMNMSNSFGMKQQQQDIQTVQRAQIWLLEAVKQCTFEMYETSITMLESAVYHMEDAQNKLGEVDLLGSVTRDLTNLNIRTSQNDQLRNQNLNPNYMMSTNKSSTMKRPLEKHSYTDYEKSQSSEGDVESMFRATARFQQ